MKKILLTALIVSLLCSQAFSAQAAQKISIQIDKKSLLTHDILDADIRIRPESMVRVTRHSLWPWDEAGTQWSMFVEIENTSDEKIVIDADALIARKKNLTEIHTAEYIFNDTTRVIEPGEKALLHAGAYPYVQGKRNNADAGMDAWDVEGMEDFADSIRRAEILDVRLEVRGNESTQNWPEMMIAPRIWIENHTLYFEWINDTEERIGFRSIGAVMRDRTGRILEVICLSHSRGADADPGETLKFQKKLPPYVTQAMIGEAEFETFAYRIPQRP